MYLEVPGVGNLREQKDWVESKKKGQDKFKKLRKKRIKGDANV
jgi:hypothetical protein